MMIPLPLRVEVIVTEFEPVSILPDVMARLTTLMLLLRLITLATPLLTVRLLNDVAPVMLASSVPFICTVDVLAVNVPLLMKLPARL